MANILITGANGQLGTELRNRSFSLLDDVFYTDIEELDITNFKANAPLSRRMISTRSSIVPRTRLSIRPRKTRKKR